LVGRVKGVSKGVRETLPFLTVNKLLTGYSQGEKMDDKYKIPKKKLINFFKVCQDVDLEKADYQELFETYHELEIWMHTKDSSDFQ